MSHSFACKIQDFDGPFDIYQLGSNVQLVIQQYIETPAGYLQLPVYSAVYLIAS